MNSMQKKLFCLFSVEEEQLRMYFRLLALCTKLLPLKKQLAFRYLLPEHVGSCNLRISYSAHTDLNIKFQSHRSRGLVKLCSRHTDVFSWQLSNFLLLCLYLLDVINIVVAITASEMLET
ncbi:unnamed protein product [Linum tenue]|uniref:Uncharacterized protein n=1 Tax=Linum tenue TaxID=586396 RepID=A0AAV0HT30_9ROSI|nr:unnamed protein product [Linum tenue]